MKWLRTSRSNLAGQYLVDILSQVEDELESHEGLGAQEDEQCRLAGRIQVIPKYARGLSVARTL